MERCIKFRELENEELDDESFIELFYDELYNESEESCIQEKVVSKKPFMPIPCIIFLIVLICCGVIIMLHESI